MALKLKQRNLLSVTNYELISNISNDKHKSIILPHFISENFENAKKYINFLNILSTDRILWLIAIE